jgi:hypothetical protein
MSNEELLTIVQGHAEVYKIPSKHQFELKTVFFNYLLSIVYAFDDFFKVRIQLLDSIFLIFYNVK